MAIERAYEQDRLAPRAVDAVIVAMLFVGNALLALWSIQAPLP